MSAPKDPGEIALLRFMAYATGQAVPLVDFYLPGSGLVHTAHTPGDDVYFFETPPGPKK